ncbi:LAFA_0B02520g1_1 [Lachancea sp. 'fantastica']|nr:LAFA_0B02520g1_1 [Lachancea sp. 'fantastica']
MLADTRLFALFLAIVHYVIAQADVNNLPASWENVEYLRNVDVSRTYLQEKVHLQIKNVDNKANDQYYYVLPEEDFDTVALFSAKLKKADAFLSSAILSEQTFVANGKAIKVGVVRLPSPIEPGKATDIVIELVYKGSVEPFPGHVSLGETQRLLLNTRKYPISAYKTESYTLKFVGSSSFTEIQRADSEVASCVNEGGELTCGTYSSLEAFTEETPIRILFDHNLPLPRVSTLNRDIWASHWASTLQFEEYYELINDAAPLAEGFSRADYMKGQYAFKPSGHLTALEMVLPSRSEDHYFTDLVGAVSTFKFLQDHLFLKPRYPIFGGWKYNFTIGWTNTLSQFLRVENGNDNTFLLSVPVLNGPDNTFYDDVNFSVYLPEGAEILDVWCPLPTFSTKVSTKHSFFDLSQGHTKVTLELKNLVDTVSESQVFVRYKFSKAALYKKPFTIATAIFVASMAYFFLKQTTFMIEQ